MTAPGPWRSQSPRTPCLAGGSPGTPEKPVREPPDLLRMGRFRPALPRPPPTTRSSGPFLPGSSQIGMHRTLWASGWSSCGPNPWTHTGHESEEATQRGRLGIGSKVSAARDNPLSKPGIHVICVYSQDASDLQDVGRVREELRHLGITWEIGYKTDADTLAARYSGQGRTVSRYRE